jgi:tyrosine-protein kinase Etk/Wzc
MGTREESSSARRSTPHLGDYLALLRRHPWVLATVFLLVFGLLVTRALLANPVYRSAALLQIEDEGTGGLLGELQGLGGGSSAEAEMQIMRSHSVAREAATRLEPNDFLAEENAYRPFEVLVRRLRGIENTPRVRVRTTALTDGTIPETWEFRFDDAGALHVGKWLAQGLLSGGSDFVHEEVAGFQPGAPFEAHGRGFTLEFDGDVRGRCYRLALRSPRDQALWIQERVRVSEVGRMTGVVRLGFEANAPRLAQSVADALASSYLDLKRTHRREQAQAALGFLREETQRVQEALRDSEEQLDRYRVEADAVVLSKRAEWLVAKISDLELQRVEQELRVKELERLEEGLAGGADPASILLPGAAPDPLVAALAEQLTQLELELDGLVEEGVLGEHPQRKRVESGIRLTRERLVSAVRGTLGRALEQARSQMRSIDETIASYEGEARSLPETERRITELTRTVRANLQIHTFLVEKEQEAQIALISTLASARLIDRPLVPHERASPLLYFQGIVALTLAAAAAILAVLFLAYMDRSVRTGTSLSDATGAPLFATVPAYHSLPRAQRRGLRKGGLVARDRPHSIIAEAYRALRTNLRFAGLDRRVKTIAITSTVPGEGKSLTTCNLAVACAKVGDRVLLIDADLRRPTTHNLFAAEPAPGLADALEDRCDWRDAVRDTGIEGLSVLHSGSPAANPAGLLNSGRLEEIVRDVRDTYDWVLVDVPPVLAVAEAASFLPNLDAVLLLARYGRCTPEMVADAAAQIRRLGANLAGSILNAVDLRRADRKGYGAYGYYGEYAVPAPARESEPVAAKDG